jgi:hypothetical protein
MGMLSCTKSHRKSSFALAEMILSVAVLVILAGFSVHMFIAAKNANARSYDLYKGMSLAISVVETVKGAACPQVLTEKDFEPEAAVSNNGREIVLDMFFDGNWSPIPSGHIDVKPFYSIKAEIVPSDGAVEHANSEYQVYEIKVQVVRLAPYVLEKGGNSEVFSIETTKCYTAFAR